MTRPSARIATLVGVLLIAGCGQGETNTTASPDRTPTEATAADSEATSSPPSPSPTPAPADATTTAPPATTPSATATALPSGPTGCEPSQGDPAAEVPNGAERVREEVGDLDGDDTPDRLVTWAVTLGDGETVFHLRVVTGSGYVAERELTEAGAMADVRPLGTVPIGDGHRAALVVEDAGASAELVSVWGLHDWEDEPCSLGRLTIADDAAPVVFPVGATAGTSNGLACTEVEGVSTLSTRTATASDGGGTHHWEQVDLHWEGAGALRTANRDEGTFSADDPRREAFASLDCAGLDL